MKKNNLLKTLILALSTSLIITPKIYASCTKEELDEFKKVEDEFYIEYELNKTTKKYDLYLHYSPKVNYYYYVNADNDYNEYIKIDETITKITNVDPGRTTIYITGTKECDDIIKDFTVTLQEYNLYSDDELCNGYEEFYLCRIDYDSSNIDYDTFISRINTYKETKKNLPSSKKGEKTIDEQNKIFEYIKDNLSTIIIIISFAIILTVFLILKIKIEKKRRRLE